MKALAALASECENMLKYWRYYDWVEKQAAKPSNMSAETQLRPNQPHLQPLQLIQLKFLRLKLGENWSDNFETRKTH